MLTVSTSMKSLFYLILAKFYVNQTEVVLLLNYIVTTSLQKFIELFKSNSMVAFDKTFFNPSSTIFDI